MKTFLKERQKLVKTLLSLAAETNDEGLAALDIEDGEMAYILEKAARYVEAVEALEEIVRNDPYKQSSAGIIARAALANLGDTK